jgi:hypothetical protein
LWQHECTATASKNKLPIKEKSMAKQDAINLVQQFAAQPGVSVWPQINRARLAAGLIERIQDPNKIHQRGTPLCGPASLVRALASDDPTAYARAAIDLYTHGTARIRALNVRAGNELKRAAPEGNADPADWILLASVRDSDNWFFSPAGWFGSNLAGITRPGTMESWLRDAGYTDIVNITYLVAKPIPSVLAAEAYRASNLFREGYKVLLFIDADMLEESTQDDAVSMYPDHWVALNSAITDGGIVNYDAPVSFSIYTWGRELSVPLNAAKPLSKRDFLGKYYGFIAAHA